MYLCTQHGYFAIVRLEDGMIHVRARVRRDLENLIELADSALRPSLEIQELKHADYRYRLIVNTAVWLALALALATHVDYPNFKVRIMADEVQRQKIAGYKDIWKASLEWQQQELQSGAP